MKTTMTIERKIMRIIALLLLITLVGCTNSSTAERVLVGAGYKNVTLTGYRFFGCGEDDLFHDGFEATGPTGQRITGVVCGGILKGSTIRLD